MLFPMSWVRARNSSSYASKMDDIPRSSRVLSYGTEQCCSFYTNTVLVLPDSSKMYFGDKERLKR